MRTPNLKYSMVSGDNCCSNYIDFFFLNISNCEVGLYKIFCFMREDIFLRTRLYSDGLS